MAEDSEVKKAITAIIRRNVAPDVFDWLQQKAALIQQEQGGTQLNLAFAAAPRKTGRQLIEVTEDERKIIEKIHEDFTVAGWTIDKLTRLWLLLQTDSSDMNVYCSKIENLFKAPEMNELAALYSSLIFFDYPQYWLRQCAEGIRSNIGIVLEAIMYNNPYPCKYLDDLAWNQLVLKAFFTDKDVKRITGLDQRVNKELALILIDYANERWAAHRKVNPQLWRLVAKFIDESNFANIEKAFKSIDITEKHAAALACFSSRYLPAKNLLESNPQLKTDIVENKLNWNTL